MAATRAGLGGLPPVAAGMPRLGGGGMDHPGAGQHRAMTADPSARPCKPSASGRLARFARFACEVALFVAGLTVSTPGAADPPPAHAAEPSRPVAVPVLIYHQIVTEPTRAKPLGETVVTLDQFAEQMRYLATHGYTTIGLDELARYMHSGGPMPDRPVVLTFDDGWKSALRAVPLLDRYGFKASFWIIAGPRGIGGPYMDWVDIERLAANPRYQIGAHTVSHPWHTSDNLVAWTQPGADDAAIERARREIADAKRILERRLRREVNALAWPRGWYNEPLVRMAREAGYTMLLTTLDGLNAPGDDLLRVKRTFVYGECGLDAFARSLHEGEDRICKAARRITQGHLPPQIRLSGQPAP